MAASARIASVRPPRASTEALADSTNPVVEDRGRERIAVAALALASFGMALNSNVLAALAPFLGDELGFDKASIGWLMSAAGYAGAIGAVVLGPIVDRVGRRPPLLWGSVVFVLATSGYLFADDFASLFAVRAATGFAAGVVFTSASAAVADLVPYQRRGAAMGVLTASIFLAIPIGMPVAVACAEAGSWRGVFVLQLATALVAMFAMARALRADARPRSDEAAPPPWVLLGEPMVVPALLSVLLYTGAFFTTVQFVGTWLDETGRLPRASQGWMWVSLGLLSAVGSAGLGRLSDRVGKRNYVLWTTLAVALCLVLLARVDGVQGLVAVGTPIAILSASRSAAMLALMSDIVVPRLRGTLLGVRAAAVNLGMAAFAGVGGEVYERAGYPTLLYAAAGGMIVAWACVRGFVRERVAP